MHSHKGVPRVQRAGCVALGDLSINNVENQAKIATASGIVAVFAAMQAYEGDVAREQAKLEEERSKSSAAWREQQYYDAYAYAYALPHACVPGDRDARVVAWRQHRTEQHQRAATTAPTSGATQCRNGGRDEALHEAAAALSCWTHAGRCVSLSHAVRWDHDAYQL